MSSFVDILFDRAKKIHQNMKETKCLHDLSLTKVDALAVAVGSANSYNKSSAFVSWLFGDFCPDSLIVVTEHGITILASSLVVNLMKICISSKEKVDAFPRFNFLINNTKKPKANFEKLMEVIKESKNGKTLGVLATDNFPGEFYQSWRAELNKQEFELVDISGALGWIMCIKDDAEVLTIKKACLVTVDVFNKYLKDHIMEIIDADKKVNHAKLAEGVEQALSDKKYVSGVDMSQLDMCYPAIIQSRGNYSLKFSAGSDKNNLHFGVIVCSLGIRYKSYCSNIVRTLLVNPSDTLQEQYNFLVSLEEEMIKVMISGKKLSDVFEAGMSYAKKEKPGLVDNLTKTFGFAMGLEFRDNSLVIGPKCDAVLRKGMVFNLNVGLSNLSDKEGKIVAMFVGDTVLVNDEENQASIITASINTIDDIKIIRKVIKRRKLERSDSVILVEDNFQKSKDEKLKQAQLDAQDCFNQFKRESEEKNKRTSLSNESKAVIWQLFVEAIWDKTQKQCLLCKSKLSSGSIYRHLQCPTHLAALETLIKTTPQLLIFQEKFTKLINTEW